MTILWNQLNIPKWNIFRFAPILCKRLIVDWRIVISNYHLAEFFLHLLTSFNDILLVRDIPQMDFEIHEKWYFLIDWPNLSAGCRIYLLSIENKVRSIKQYFLEKEFMGMKTEIDWQLKIHSDTKFVGKVEEMNWNIYFFHHHW